MNVWRGMRHGVAPSAKRRHRRAFVFSSTDASYPGYSQSIATLMGESFLAVAPHGSSH